MILVPPNDWFKTIVFGASILASLLPFWHPAPRFGALPQFGPFPFWLLAPFGFLLSWLPTPKLAPCRI